MKCCTKKPGQPRCGRDATHTIKLGYTVKRTKKKESAELHFCAQHYLEVKNITMSN